MQKRSEIKVNKSLLKCSLCSGKLAAYSSENVFSQCMESVMSTFMFPARVCYHSCQWCLQGSAVTLQLQKSSLRLMFQEGILSLVSGVAPQINIWLNWMRETETEWTLQGMVLQHLQNPHQEKGRWQNMDWIMCVSLPVSKFSFFQYN